MTGSKRWLLLVALGGVLLGVIATLLWRERSRPVPHELPGDRKTLARVNDTPITEYDLTHAVESTLGPYAQSQLSGEARHKLLESLVLSRAIAQAEEAVLSPESKAALDRKVAVYREQSLVTEYLNEHSAVQAVTPEMVKAYYDAHREKFGGTSTRFYELITSERIPNEPERNGIIAALKGAESEKDWKSWALALRKKGTPLAFREGEVDAKTLDTRLVTLLSSLPVGKASALSFIEGRAYVVRVTREAAGTARPLSEVSASIRQLLGPEQVAKALKTASDRVLPEARVEYPTPNSNNPNSFSR